MYPPTHSSSTWSTRLSRFAKTVASAAAIFGAVSVATLSHAPVAQAADTTMSCEQTAEVFGLDISEALESGTSCPEALKAAIDGSPMGSGDGYAIDFLWTMIAAILVFWMQAGFSLVEAGFTRAKNAVNIFMKNIMDFAIGSIAFWALGFGLMFGESSGWIGTSGFFMSGLEGNNWNFQFLFFQTVFAATAATIVSGAVAERTKFVGYLAYSFILSALVYPIFGSWAWGGLFQGGGWLEGGEGSLLASIFGPDAAFIDFAGSTVVHSVGGWAALAGAIVIGPRIGKFGPNGEPRPIRGHSMSLATLGVFILWMGWFGFNAGSTTGVVGSAGDHLSGAGKSIAWIAVTTNLSACAGCLVAMLVSWKTAGKPDIGMTLNGALAGLVGITAGCANVTPVFAVVIGAISGALVVGSVHFIDKLRIDDPVGAISVHGVCGAWGTLAAGLFSANGMFDFTTIAVQLTGIVACFLYTFPVTFVMFTVIKKTIGLRASQEEEIEGLDLSEHGSEAYPRDIGSHGEGAMGGF